MPHPVEGLGKCASRGSLRDPQPPNGLPWTAIDGRGFEMYKLLLSWRYLRTRYIALASIISVTLGVGTLIVVNSVMAGFTREMHVRLHGILSDIIVESHSMDGMPNSAAHIAEIRRIVGGDLVGMTAAVHVPAM